MREVCGFCQHENCGKSENNCGFRALDNGGGKRYIIRKGGQDMPDAEMLIEEIKTLPADYAAEALDFIGYLKEKAAKRQEGCPICAKHRDPQTGELRFNAETMAAFEEVDAMIRGEIPTKWYNSLEEMLADLDE